MEVHEVANIFPMMSEEEYRELVRDIKENGLREPIWTYQGKIIDGRNRYKACKELGIAPRFREWDGKGSLVAFVVSLNLHRRHLNSSQKAMASIDALKWLEKEARERQLATLKQNASVPEIFPEREKGESREKAAKMFGTNERYVSDAKKIAETAPELVEHVKEGRLNIPEAKELTKLSPEQRVQVLERVTKEPPEKEIKIKNVVREIKREEAEKTARAIESAPVAVMEKPIEVEPGDFWRLGDHVLYCGDTSDPVFIERAPNAPFAFADPPYNANAAEWDHGFLWEHDWLQEKAEVVAVTPGIVSIFDFARRTKMPYKWSVACWISNGMTRGGLGFGNWIYVALFSHEGLFRNSQDFLSVTIRNNETEETDHKGRKPTELLLWLFERFAVSGEWVIDPFLGSGTTLLAAEKKGMRCYGGEIEPDFCRDIINRWQAMTGGKAVKENG